MWLPERTLGPGEWLTVHVRVTNERDGPIYLLCYPTYSKLDIHELFDPGREWTGAAARFKDAVVAGTPLGINELANGPDLGCCGGIHFAVVNAPGSIYWPAHGFEGPAPDATVVMGEFPSEVLLDPWTAQVIGFDPGRPVRP